MYSTRASVPNLAREREIIINRLSILRGEQPRGLLDIVEPSSSIPRVPAQIAIGIPHDLVRRRPDVRAAEQKVIASGVHRSSPGRAVPVRFLNRRLYNGHKKPFKPF